ncbi:glycosyltransferase [Lactiplantibacillus plantarum]|uniref:glycosyltransferase n=1 Tax=Lactiplantibacillus plantarum TaxID=1590 RepID=UPI0021820493|nr:glycosyltransferase [Lactiplantibacillus plantarum]MCS8590895.1 glycosyltransferase [Lactiplantibacillus plantarum]
MKILHYSLGFPPERSGGLIRYTMDLMNEQIRQGEEVCYLYPGHINVLKNRTYIKADRKHSKANFTPYVLVNSLPLPLFGGIKNPNDFMRPVNAKLYLNFLGKIRPDVIHVHTLMGIHKEFFECAQSLGIRIVFTSHDYFGLAPEPTFYYQGSNYDDNNTIEQWMKISQTAMPTWKLRLFQISFYPAVRRIAHKFKSQKNIILDAKEPKYNNNKTNISDIKNDFVKLKKYYLSIFSLINYFHFNSHLALSVYQNNLVLKKNYSCISITNSTVKYRSSMSQVPMKGRKLRIAYIGPYKSFKGFFDFLKLPKITNLKIFEYHVYGSDDIITIPNTVINHGHFKKDDIDKVYRNIDVVIVPSRCKETFGFVTIEALSHNKPVLASSNVGAKDIIDGEFIFKTISDVPQQLEKVASYILEPQKNMSTHYEEIRQIYHKN